MLILLTAPVCSRLPGSHLDLPDLPSPRPGQYLPRGWFLYRLIEADFALFSASANGGAAAFFAHVGGFIFGVLVTRALTGAGRITAQQA